jgi:hypothetical protein
MVSSDQQAVGAVGVLKPDDGRLTRWRKSLARFLGCAVLLVLATLVPAAAPAGASGQYDLIGEGVTYGPEFSTTGPTLEWAMEWVCTGVADLHVNLDDLHYEKRGHLKPPLEKWEYVAKVTRFEPLPSLSGKTGGLLSIPAGSGQFYRISVHAPGICRYGIRYFWK